MNMNQSEQFWEEHYRSREAREPGEPNAVLAQFGADLSSGAALDLGCSQGDDAIWLARRGWRVVAVDVSQTALERAARTAASAGVAERVKFEQHDLSRSFPAGEFDLVSALFLQSPVDFSRARVLRQAAQAVAVGGTLLLTEHASVAPWSWSRPDTVFPSPQDWLAELELHPDEWKHEFVGRPQRRASGPDGQSAFVEDNVLMLKRVKNRVDDNG